MKHWKNLLVCLLAGVLALGVLTACSGLGSVNTGTDAEKAAELAQQLGVAHTQELDSTAMTAQLYAPQADSAAAELLEDAAGHSELGAAFIDYNGTAYIVAVFR